jgi:hypothetical protein
MEQRSMEVKWNLLQARSAAELGTALTLTG